MCSFVALLVERFNARLAVVAAAQADGHVPRLPGRSLELPMDNRRTNTVRAMALFLRFVRVLRRERPSVTLAYTVKPNIYGSLAARVGGVTVINNNAGPGAAVVHLIVGHQTERLRFLRKHS